MRVGFIFINIFYSNFKILLVNNDVQLNFSKYINNWIKNLM